MKLNLIKAITSLYPRFFPSRYSGILSEDHVIRAMGVEWGGDDSILLGNPDVSAVGKLIKIWGVGVKTAAQLVLWGVRDVDGLKADKEIMETLNPQQRVGVARYYDLIEKMSRDEVEEIAGEVKKAVRKICRWEVKIVVCGSYRRGKSESGDVDILLLPSSKDPNKDNVAIEVRGRLRA